MKIEIYHDILAKKILEKVSGDKKMLRKVERLIHERFEFYLAQDKNKKGLLNQNDLDTITPYLSSAKIDQEEQAFIKKSQRAQRQSARIRAAGIGIALLILGLLAFSIYQWQSAQDNAKKAEDSAIEANKQRGIAEIEKGKFEDQAQISDSLRVEAEAEKDTANILRRKAESETVRANTNALKATTQQKIAEAHKMVAEVQAHVADTLRLKAEKANEDLVIAQDNFMTSLLEDANKNIERIEHLQALGNLNTIIKIGHERSGLHFSVDWKKQTIDHYYEIAYFFTQTGNDLKAKESIIGRNSLTKKNDTFLLNLYSISLYNNSKSLRRAEEIIKIAKPCLEVAIFLNKEDHLNFDEFDFPIQYSDATSIKSHIDAFIKSIEKRLPNLKMEELKKLNPKKYAALQKAYYPSKDEEQQTISLRKFGMYWALTKKENPENINWQDAIDYAKWASRDLSGESYLPGVTQRFSSSEYWIRKRISDEPIIFIAYLPIFYFDHDQPDSKSLKMNIRSYLETAYNYLSNISHTITFAYDPEELSRISKFLNELENTIPFLKIELPENIKAVYDAGFKLKFETTGYASLRAKNNYNRSLTQRRISAVENYIRDYLPPGTIDDSEFIQEPQGEGQASNKIANEPKGQKQSIYSYDAATQRRVNLTIKVLKK